MLETLDNSEQEDAAIVPEGGVLWSDVVRDFGIAYDNVFDRVGRKVYLDFNRSLTPGTKYIDGAKKRWKLPCLMDSIVCAFYQIQPNTYGRKARKFNQHEILLSVLQTIVTRVKENFAGPLTFVIDLPAWTTFANLRREFEYRDPKKSVTKYQSISSLYLTDEGMVQIGLPGVLSKVIDILQGITAVILTASAEDYSATVDVLRTMRSIDSASSDDEKAADDMVTTLPIPATSTVSIVTSGDSGETMSSLQPLLHTEVAKSSSRDRRRESATTFTTIDDVDTGDWTAYPTSLFTIRSYNGAPLKTIHGDGSSIAFSARVCEGLEIRLVNSADPLEWIFKAKDAAGALTLIQRGRLRVLGNDLLIAAYTPFI